MQKDNKFTHPGHRHISSPESSRSGARPMQNMAVAPLRRFTYFFFAHIYNLKVELFERLPTAHFLCFEF